MTKHQSTQYMNLLARILHIIEGFTLPFSHIHALKYFEETGMEVYEEFDTFMGREKNVDVLLGKVEEKLAQLEQEEKQKSILTAYHMCIWLDRCLAYESSSEDKFFIYAMLPLEYGSIVEVDALNTNYEETGIWINPRIASYKAVNPGIDGQEYERNASARDAFYGINGELKNIFYFVWNNDYKVHNIILRNPDIEPHMEGELKIGFIPVSDRHDLIKPACREVLEGEYHVRQIYVEHPEHEEVICARMETGLQLAAFHDIDIVFAPEMLGCDALEVDMQAGKYNSFVRNIYGGALAEGGKPPVLTIMPSQWKSGINQATILYRDGKILGRQRKHTAFVDFKSNAVEGIVKKDVKEIILIHLYRAHRIAVMICAEFIDASDRDFICGKLGATLILVPSYSHGEADFIHTMGALFPYGTYVVWGDCCGAVEHAPKAIGGCSLIGEEHVYTMGSFCMCSHVCDATEGCLFKVNLPLKAILKKDKDVLSDPIEHIVKNVEEG